jgi:hypothetical protein
MSTETKTETPQAFDTFQDFQEWCESLLRERNYPTDLERSYFTYRITNRRKLIWHPTLKLRYWGYSPTQMNDDFITAFVNTYFSATAKLPPGMDKAGAISIASKESFYNKQREHSTTRCSVTDCLNLGHFIHNGQCNEHALKKNNKRKSPEDNPPATSVKGSDEKDDTN